MFSLIVLATDLASLSAHPQCPTSPSNGSKPCVAHHSWGSACPFQAEIPELLRSTTHLGALVSPLRDQMGVKAGRMEGEIRQGDVEGALLWPPTPRSSVPKAPLPLDPLWLIPSCLCTLLCALPSHSLILYRLSDPCPPTHLLLSPGKPPSWPCLPLAELTPIEGSSGHAPCNSLKQ